MRSCLGVILCAVILCVFVSDSCGQEKQQTEQKFSATLPDGMLVELIGLRHYSIKDLPKNRDQDYIWWQPDGSTLEIPPVASNSNSSVSDSYYFVLCIKGKMDCNSKVSGLFGSTNASSVIKKEPMYKNDDLRYFTLNFPSGQKESTIFSWIGHK